FSCFLSALQHPTNRDNRILRCSRRYLRILTVATKVLVRFSILLCGMFLALLVPARAQDNYEIQVYSFDLVEPHHTMVELHSTFTIAGTRTISDGLYPTNH